MTENPQAPLINDTDKLAVTLRELEAERQRRMSAGQWSCATLPKLVAIPETGETVEVAQQRALYAHLADNPDAPKAIAAYDWMELRSSIPSRPSNRPVCNTPPTTPMLSM